MRMLAVMMRLSCARFFDRRIPALSGICISAVISVLLLPPGSLFAAAPPRTTPLRLDRNGDPLPPGAIARLGAARLQNLPRVSDFVLSPDGRTLATIAGHFRVWDVVTGRLLRDCERLSQNEKVLCLLNGGRGLITRDEQNVWFRDLGNATKQTMGLNPDQQRNATTVVLAPDNRTVAIRIKTEAEKPLYELLLVDLHTSRHIKVLETAQPSVSPALGFSSDTRRLVFGLGDTVRIFDLIKRKELTRIDINGWMRAVAFSPDGKWIVVHRQDFNLLLASATSPARVTELGVQHGSDSALAFAADGKSLLFVNWLSPVLGIDLKNERKPRVVRAVQNVRKPVFSSDGRILALFDRSAFGSSIERFSIWDMTPRRERPLTGSPETEKILDAVPSPDGRRVATVGPDGIGIWDLKSAQKQRMIRGKAFLPRLNWYDSPGVSWTPDGRALVSASGNEVTWWSTETGRPTRRLTLPGKDIVSFKVLNMGNYFLCVERNHVILTLRLGDANTGKLLIDDHSNAIDLSPDARLFLEEERDKDESNRVSLRLKERGTGRTLWHHIEPDPRREWRGRRIPAFSFCKLPSFSPDGRFVVLTTGNGVQILETKTGRPLVPSPGSKPWLTDAVVAAVSSDGRIAAATTSSRLSSFTEASAGLVLLEVATGRLRRRLPLGDFQHHFAFMPDGRHLITCHTDGTVLLWDAYAELAPSGKLTPVQGLQCWHDLAGDDVEKAFKRICRLIAAPKEAVPLIASHLKPVYIDQNRLRGALADLDDDTFEKREKAQKFLTALGVDIEVDLRKALEAKPSLELRRRLERLLAALRIRDSTELRRSRALEVLERIATPEAIAVLKELAAGSAGSRLTREAHETLERLKRMADRPGIR
jgi:WD40 repeat protein